VLAPEECKIIANGIGFGARAQQENKSNNIFTLLLVISCLKAWLS